MKYYLRMEGVNIGSFVGDVQDLSTIRGGSLLLLNSVDEVAEEFANHLHPLTTGASNGTFAFDAEDDDKAETLRGEIARFLSTHQRLRHATFVVDVQRTGHDFLFDREAVLARNRWRQWQQSTIVVPERNHDPTVRECAIDALRPGVCKGTVKGEKDKPVSSSAATRREYGRNMKHCFYAEQMKKYFKDCTIDRQSAGFSFVQDLQSLTSDNSRENLDGKMAVIYLDGNSFGKIQSELCRTATEQKHFDTLLKERRAEALKSLLEMMHADPAGSNGEALRLETLLWGGDELIWVVPAWFGWRVLGNFYAISEEWQFKEKRLTHAGGMVFCHHNAPIHRICKLAKDLAEAAKIEAKKSEQPGNLFQYVVLETFDHLGRDLESFRRVQCPAEWKISLDGNSMLDVAADFATLKERFPRNKVFTGVHAALADAKTSGREFEEKFKIRLEEIVSREARETVERLSGSHFGTAPGLWLHLADLWDYIPDKED